MKVMIVTCFESNEERVNYIYDACLSRGYDVKAISSDFSHIRKEKRDKSSGNIMLLEAKPYKKNMSVERMLSHHEFAKDAFALLSEYKPDLIWLIAPANSLIAEADKYKKRNPETKMIIDIIDMWPESLPVDLNKNILPFNIWRSITVGVGWKRSSKSWEHKFIKGTEPKRIRRFFWTVKLRWQKTRRRA